MNILIILFLFFVVAPTCLIVALGIAKSNRVIRNRLETSIRSFLILCSCIAIVTTVGIVLSVLFESIRFFNHVPVTDFLFGLEWSPQTAIRSDQVGSSGAFGAVPLFAGTFLITFIAVVVAVPLGLMSAIYLSEYAGNTVAHCGQTTARNPRRYSHGCLRILRSSDRCTTDSRRCPRLRVRRL